VHYRWLLEKAWDEAAFVFAFGNPSSHRFKRTMPLHNEKAFMTTKDLIEISSCVGRKGNDSSDVPFDPWTR